jgi:multidrug efflux pump subunit AcrA (membrane-fusion protein)
VVVERLLGPGEYRNDQSPVLTLAQIDPLRVEVFMPTAHFGQIRVGSKAEVRPEEIGGIHVAIVTVVDHVLDAASGTFGVRLTLPNPQLVLPAGIHCKVTFAMHPPGIVPALVTGDAERSGVPMRSQCDPRPMTGPIRQKLDVIARETHAQSARLTA